MSREQREVSGKQARLQVSEQLQQSLPGLRDILGEEEFIKRVKKAAKILAAGIKAPAPRKEKRRQPRKEEITSQAA